MRASPDAATANEGTRVKVKAIDWKRLPLIDRLLREQHYEELEAVLAEHADQELLGDEALAAARAMNLVPTVIYLATLGAENLPDPGNRVMWMEVYRTLGRKAPTEGFLALPKQLPVRWVAQNAISGKKPDLASLRQCKGRLEDWRAAFELAVDHGHYNLMECVTNHLLAQKLSVDDWLDIVGMLVQRDSMLDTKIDTLPLARSLLRICKRLPGQGLGYTRTTLALRAANYFRIGGAHAQAISAAEFITEPDSLLLKMILISEAYCHLGDLPRSIEWIDRLLLAAIAQTKHVDEIRSWYEANKKPKAQSSGFNPEKAGQALVALQEILDRTGHKVFLVSGTLLGYAREGQLLAHDKDVDVGVMNWESQFDIVLALADSDQFMLSTRTMVGAQTYALVVLHVPTGITIDIFIYHPEGAKLVTGVQNEFGYLQKFAFTPFGLSKVDFLNTKIYVPDDVDRNLIENFGSDWRTPDPGYISHLESPSTVDVGGLVYQLVGRQTCLMAIQKSNPKKLMRTLDCLECVQDRPGGMKPVLLGGLRQLAENFPEKPATNEASQAEAAA
jgi:hypothetical protein